MSFKLSLIIIFLFSFTKVYTDNVSLHHDYSLSRLFSRGAKDLCTNITCKDKPHTMCIEASYVAPNCKYFQKIEFTHEKIRNILNGHNGLRNRIAVDRYKPASNMLYLHWDKELEQMAGKHLQRCLIQNDTCDFIGKENLTVGQNIKFKEGNLPRNFELQIIRAWFMEGNYFDHVGRNILEPGIANNYTQFVWAKTEKLGCAAAKMFDGYMMVCNYSPKGNIDGDNIFELGDPCSDCPGSSASCSRIFRGLCGIDDVIYAKADRFRATRILIYLILTALLNYFGINFFV